MKFYPVKEENLAIHESPRNTYGDTLVQSGERFSNIVVLDADLAESTQTKRFKKRFPGKFFDAGVAEQNLMGVAAGLAMSGKIVFASTFAYFGSGSKTFQLNSYKDGVSYKSAPNTIELVELLASKNGYVSDFNTTNTDFSGNMTIKTESGFANAAIHSAHPYGKGLDYIYLLKVPIIVAENNATLTYDDIAIVEPGDPGSVYGNTNFWDYVIVEASKGGDWIPLSDGYDCRADSRWLTAYNAGGSGTPAMWKSHSVNLRNFFSAGDEIIIRFRLFADQYVDGWGWAIDNLSIQPLYVGVEDEVIPTKFELSQNYPNPFNPTTAIKFSLAKESKVSLKVFNNLGEQVAELVNGNKSAGNYRINFNASNLASGIYYYRLEAGDFVQTRKMILLK